jgi:hypothetical protein
MADSADGSTAGSEQAGSAEQSGAGSAEQSGASTQAETGVAPLLTVVRGDASVQEIAALVAVLAAKSAGSPSLTAGPAQGERVCGWSNRSALLRKPLSHGPGAWRASGRPG